MNNFPLKIPFSRSSVPVYLLAEESLSRPRVLTELLSALLDADGDGMVTAEEARDALRR